ncbi:hypothetical protein RFI_08906 [Reticulomyxa filosa]|uniref:Calreticulin n=1 Tax=Reticulomyxa filosa TaxID=46433 RepID=X6NSA4_RETFI|nr:hypothetical protein RFI_08906 [Reticulomyxa filosa]|eukprot:ETO28222.1 hypothetical protein RFI_08906 [Reticulomyxa filosa]
MRSLSVLLACVGAATATTYFKETFESDPFANNRWVVSKWKQDSGEAGEWEWSTGLWTAHTDRKGLRTTQDARFYSISSPLEKPFDNSGNTLVFQFKAKHEQKIDCGGGYVKLLPPDADVKNLNGDTSYTIMFGPDICGYSTKKVHTIFNHNGENLLKKSDVSCPDDELTHTYTLIVNGDDTYEIRVDGEKKDSGKLKEGWDFEKPKTIPDPKVLFACFLKIELFFYYTFFYFVQAKKPSDWVDNEFIDDPNDIKPSDWDDEPEKISDPDATKPADWDDEEDGQWEAPLIDNPKYKGEWKPKQIKNPAYKGPWVHPEIPNPDYVEHKNVHKRGSIGHVGIEIWQVKSGTLFSDFILTDSIEEAEAFAKERSIKKDDEEKAKKTYDEANKGVKKRMKKHQPVAILKMKNITMNYKLRISNQINCCFFVFFFWKVLEKSKTDNSQENDSNFQKGGVWLLWVRCDLSVLLVFSPKKETNSSHLNGDMDPRATEKNEPPKSIKLEAAYPCKLVQFFYFFPSSFLFFSLAKKTKKKKKKKEKEVEQSEKKRKSKLLNIKTNRTLEIDEENKSIKVSAKLSLKSNHKYIFDKMFTEKRSQEEIWDEMGGFELCQEMCYICVSKAKKETNQINKHKTKKKKGKSYTVWGNGKDNISEMGLFPRLVSNLIQMKIEQRTEMTYHVYVSKYNLIRTSNGEQKRVSLLQERSSDYDYRVPDIVELTNLSELMLLDKHIESNEEYIDPNATVLCTVSQVCVTHSQLEIHHQQTHAMLNINYATFVEWIGNDEEDDNDQDDPNEHKNEKEKEQ